VKEIKLPSCSVVNEKLVDGTIYLLSKKVVKTTASKFDLSSLYEFFLSIVSTYGCLMLKNMNGKKVIELSS
jgi:hypothetical protein